MDEMGANPSTGEGREPAYERRDVGKGVVVAAVVILLLAVGLVHVLTTGLYVIFTGAQPIMLGPTATPQVTPLIPPDPRLQVAPAGEWQRLQATQQAILEDYGWVDEGTGVLRIPIDRAMDLLVERGLPTPPDRPEEEHNP